MAFSLWQGATPVTMPRFDLEQFLTILQDYRVTRAALVPPILLALAKHPLVDRFDLSALRFIASGAAPLGAELEQACGKRLACVSAQATASPRPARADHHPARAGQDPARLGRAAAAQHRRQGRRAGHRGRRWAATRPASCASAARR